jgi:hypothetical protein
MLEQFAINGTSQSVFGLPVALYKLTPDGTLNSNATPAGSLMNRIHKSIGYFRPIRTSHRRDHKDCLLHMQHLFGARFICDSSLLVVPI